VCRRRHYRRAPHVHRRRRWQVQVCKRSSSPGSRSGDGDGVGILSHSHSVAGDGYRTESSGSRSLGRGRGDGVAFVPHTFVTTLGRASLPVAAGMPNSASRASPLAGGETGGGRAQLGTCTVAGRATGCASSKWRGSSPRSWGCHHWSTGAGDASSEGGSADAPEKEERGDGVVVGSENVL
jgi:hypothetical protein